MQRPPPPSAEMLELIDDLTKIVDAAWQDDWPIDDAVAFVLGELGQRMAVADLPAEETKRCQDGFRITGDIISTRQIIISCLGTLSDRSEFANLLAPEAES
jgi:HEAT repeat protein